MFKGYLLTCGRCLSFWMGIAAVVVYFINPWFNWPFAVSWIYIWVRETRQARVNRIEALDSLRFTVTAR